MTVPVFRRTLIKFNTTYQELRRWLRVRLALLRNEGVVILGSGMSFHTMRGYGDPRAPTTTRATWRKALIWRHFHHRLQCPATPSTQNITQFQRDKWWA
jgi:uracil-DNA glycosylase